MQSFYDEGLTVIADSRSITPSDEEYSLADCDQARLYMPTQYSGADKLDEGTELAFYIVSWRNGLRNAGFPDAVWRPDLIQYEDRELNTIAGTTGDDSDERRTEFRRYLARKLNNYRQTTATSLPKVVPDDEGCGAGEADYGIRTDPPGGRVWLIPVYFYRLCKAQGLDPDNSQSCDRWRQAPNGLVQPLSGDYYYYALWPDGTRTGRTFLAVEGPPETVFTIPKP
jgi:hypothetical protein